MSTVTERGIFQILKLTTIKRWNIVECSKDQSVAEHSYRVWVLASDLYDQMFPVEHNSFERENLHKLALIHDLDEVYSGDIPSTVKVLLEGKDPGIMQWLQSSILEQHHPDIAGFMRGMHGTLAYHLVKIADVVEALLFIDAYGIDRLHVTTVIKDGLDRLKSRFDLAVKRYPQWDWRIAHRWLNQVIPYIMGLYGVPKGCPDTVVHISQAECTDAAESG